MTSEALDRTAERVAAQYLQDLDVEQCRRRECLRWSEQSIRDRVVDLGVQPPSGIEPRVRP